MLPGSLLDGEAVRLAGLVLLLTLHSLPHSVVEVVVVVARLDHLGYQLMEGVRSEVVGMEIPVLGARSGIFSGSENYIWNNISAVMLANKNQLPIIGF